MKYIRIKDFRIAVQGEPSDKGFKQGRIEIHNFGNVPTLAPFSDDDILRKSNSIKELCDKFVYIGWDGEINVCDELMEDCDLVSAIDYEAIYGAILTDKGLIFVAKVHPMKGELELL